MAFKLLYTNLAGPQGDFLVDPAASFEAGQVGKLVDSNGLPQVALAAAAASGTLLGIIDDNKTSQFVATVVNEAVGTGTTLLNHANIVVGTFASSGSTTTLTSATNGAVTASADDLVSYSYYIPGKAGDDTTLASGKCTLWLQPGEYATDVYEVATSSSGVIAYAVGAQLYSSANSKLTTEAGNVVVGYVTKAPSAGNPFLNFYKI